jgi:hypothetical protein
LEIIEDGFYAVLKPKRQPYLLKISLNCKRKNKMAFLTLKYKVPSTIATRAADKKISKIQNNKMTSPLDKSQIIEKTEG